jgi:hypothetical protein
MEVQADRKDLLPDTKALERATLGELVQRYRDTVTAKKRGGQVESLVADEFRSLRKLYFGAWACVFGSFAVLGLLTVLLKRIKGYRSDHESGGFSF